MQSQPEQYVDGTRFALRTSTGTHFISYTEVIYCEADGRYTRIHLRTNKCITVARHLKEFEEKLPKDIFFRIHNSYLVNLNFATGLDKSNKNHLIVNNNNKLSVSRRKMKLLMIAIRNRIVYI